MAVLKLLLDKGTNAIDYEAQLAKGRFLSIVVYLLNKCYTLMNRNRVGAIDKRPSLQQITPMSVTVKSFITVLQTSYSQPPVTAARHCRLEAKKPSR